MRDRLFRFRRMAVAVLTGATVLGGVSVVGASSASATTAAAAAGAQKPLFVNAGQNAQAASNWLVQLPNAFVSGDTLTFAVNGNPSGTNCAAANAFVGFASTPTVTVLGNTSATFGTASATDTTPTFSEAISTPAAETNCTNQGVKDLLTITINTTATGAATDLYDLAVSGVTYNVGSAATNGAGGGLTVSFNGGAANSTAGDSTTAGVALGALDGKLSNAVIDTVNVGLSAAPPAVTPSTAGNDTAVPNIVFTESVGGGVPTGWVCATLSAGTFDATSTPAVAATGTGAAATGAAYVNSSTTVEFDVTTASTAAGTYTVSGLAVDPPAAGGPVTISVTDANTTAGGAATNCSGGATLPQASGAYAPRLYYVASASRIQGSDADATAIAEVETVYDCSTINGGVNGLTTSAATVVLATDSGPYDALAASFLAGHLGTGILLTPTASLSSETQAALRQLGIAHVIVVGGPVAVSDTVVQQLQALQAYGCNGSPVVSGGVSQMLTVTRIYGATALDTAADIAQYEGKTAIRSIAVPGAYGNLYNDTTGQASATGPTSVTSTMILATDNGFQDAVAASAAAYNQDGSGDNFPIALTDPSSLSSQAQAVITNMSIGQVILMGGPVAVSDNVVTQLQALGVSVLRIAGQDLTDTASMLAAFELNNTNSAGKVDGLNWETGFDHNIYVARGDFYSDGLVGGVVAGSAQDPLLLTLDPNTVGAGLAAFLNVVGSAVAGVPAVYSITALGGIQAVTPATVSTMLGDLAAG